MTATDTTTDRLQEIRDRTAAATAGPWRASIVDSPRATATTAIYSHAHPAGSAASEVLPSTDCKPGQDLVRPADAEFIAHSREDVDLLLQEVDALREAVAEERLQGQREIARLREQIQTERNHYRAMRDRHNAAIADLRARIAALAEEGVA